MHEDRLVQAPEKPLRGMRFWVQDPKYRGRKHPVGIELRIFQANRRYFAYQEFPFGEPVPSGPRRKLRNDQWKPWLTAMSKGKDVFLNGQRMVPSEPEPRVPVRMDTVARDLRLQRAARQVLQDYRIKPVTESSGESVFEVRRDALVAYRVVVRRDWSTAPTCTCPDAARSMDGARRGSWCKHVLAVLMSTEELRGQLLDLFL